MAARKLAASTEVSQRRRGPGKKFQKGVSGNPGGMSSEQRQAADAQRALAQTHGQELLPDGRTRVRAVLDAVCAEAIAGSAPHGTLYLAYTVGKPVDNVRLDGDLRLAIARRVYEPPQEPGADGNS